MLMIFDFWLFGEGGRWEGGVGRFNGIFHIRDLNFKI